MDIGYVLSGRYEIEELVGEGGMSTVYRAYDRVLARTVAIKVLREQFSASEASRGRFRKEALSAARLSHPNIVGVFDVGTDQGFDYIVMEFVAGRSLEQEMKGFNGPMPVLKAVGIVNQILDGLWHAHSHGLVHRDIKPHNILISSDGRVKIADFGIARASSETDLTQTGMVVGTVNYTSPEQAKGEVATNKSDLYSTGVLLYEMLTGKLPFTGEGQVAVAIKHISEKPSSPRRMNPAISPMLERAIFKSMEKDPARRFQSADEFKAALMLAEGAYIKREADGKDDTIVSKTSGSATKTFRKVEGGGVGMKDRGKSGYDQKKGLRNLIILISVFVVFATAVAGGVYLAWDRWMDVDEVKVPDVVGMNIEDAKVRLKELKLNTVIEDSRYDEAVPADFVISQVPPAGTSRKVNSDIELIVSLGPDLGTVPDVIGKDLREAGIILESAGFTIGDNVYEYDPIVPEGMIIRHDPPAGSTLDKGMPVTVVISQGPSPTITVPDIVGFDYKEAESLIKAAGLNIGLIIEAVSEAYPKGTVMAQTPIAGTEVDSGSLVDLKVSTTAQSMGAGSGEGSKKFEVSYTVPKETWIQEVVMKVNDTYGSRIVFGPKSLKSGEGVVQMVEVFGGGRIEVWVDGALYKAYDV